MNRVRQRVYVSMTTSDLASVRQTILDALIEAGCEPVDIVDYPPYWRTADRLLNDQIGSCYGLIHVAGTSYGPEPQLPTKPSGEVRRSFAQMEYHIGCQLRDQSEVRPFFVHTLIGPADFAYDTPPAQESLALQDLQWQHSASLTAASGAQEIPSSAEEVTALVRSWFLVNAKTEIASAPSARKQPVPKGSQPISLRFALAAAIILMGLGCIGWAVSELMQKSGGGKAAAVGTSAVVQIPADKLIAAYLDRFRAWRFALQTIPNAYVDQLVRADLPAVLGVTPEAVAQALSSEMEPMSRQSTDVTAKLGALFVIGRYQNVLEHGAVHKETLDDRARHLLGDASLALYDENSSVFQQEQAVKYYEEAASSKLREISPIAWSQRQVGRARQMAAQGFSRKAVPLLREVLAVQEKHHMEELPGTLVLLADTLPNGEKAAAVEAAALLQRAESLLAGKSGTAIGHLASCLFVKAYEDQDLGYSFRREHAYRHGMEMLEKSFGPNHPALTEILYILGDHLLQKDQYFRLQSDETWLGIFWKVMRKSRVAEADRLFRRSLVLIETTRGPNHLKTSEAVKRLGVMLSRTNRYPEAEVEMHRALALKEASLNARHPSILITKVNLASILVVLKRYAEVEPILRGVLDGLDDFGEGDSESMLVALSSLVTALAETNRYTEALPIMKRVSILEAKYYGEWNQAVCWSLVEHANIHFTNYGFTEGLQAAGRAVKIVFKYQAQFNAVHESTLPAIKLYFLNATRNQQSIEQVRAKVEQMATEAGVTPESAKEMIDTAIR